MDLSRKIILASGLGAAFLAFGIGCTVEDRDLEEKDVFLCQKDDDCLDGSKCIKVNQDKMTVGRCVREDQIDHCVDADKDGYLTVTEEKFSNECGFSTTNPKDPDDSDPLVYPGAAEVCDGKDNSGDGCVDATCPQGEECTPNKTNDPEKNDPKCKRLISPCLVAGSIESYNNSVCSASRIGAMICVLNEENNKAQEVFAIRNESGDYIIPPKDDKSVPHTCPASLDLISGYDDADKSCDGIDSNCNGQIDEGCVSCSSDPKVGKKCYVITGAKGEKEANYNAILDTCGGDVDSCVCLGVYGCESEEDNPVCQKNGVTITESSISSADCAKMAE